VFANILINAGDAISDKGTITITTECKEGMVWVTIADTGRGIPAREPAADLQPLFHHQGRRPGHRPGPEHCRQHRQIPGRHHQGEQHSGNRQFLYHPAADQ
jgi:hypothetical protein